MPRSRLGRPDDTPPIGRMSEAFVRCLACSFSNIRRTQTGHCTMLERAMPRGATLKLAAPRHLPSIIISRFPLLMWFLVLMLLVMTLPEPKIRATMTASEREALLEALLLDEPELGFTARGNPDPRLVRLVRLLGRQAARENFEAQMKARGTGAS